MSEPFAVSILLSEQAVLPCAKINNTGTTPVSIICSTGIINIAIYGVSAGKPYTLFRIFDCQLIYNHIYYTGLHHIPSRYSSRPISYRV